MAAPSEYLRAKRDAEFRDRVARAYGGANDVLDALWWREHPGSPTPAGVESPAARRAELQRTAFAPAAKGSADAVPRADRAAAELAQLDAALAEEREAIDQAVAEATAVGTALAVADADEPPTDGETAPARRPQRVRRRLAAVAAVGFVLALVGGAVGFTLAQATGGSIAGLGAGGGPPFADASAALAIFDRPSQPADQPPVLYAVQLREETLRTLSMADTPLYVARDIDDDVCIVLVQDNGTYTANCVPPDRFPSTGLLIRGSIAVTGRPSQGDQLPQSFVDVEASWLPDGTTVWGQNPQTR
ncbi:hypothetical protein [Herbiconiux flava]|uniref:Uncharacterized protein n=1 Tax=Herbiconiux flava TaxID=881268 RepID=A0A852SA45_9MICO|nr:hypothetical protein [Herbiconiux flava]NYD69232.1 hypothetical protein [Herbiconiux flava]GLK15980.1 hypothetical protein GCM10017602_04620 [Herbiconiux flava]